MEQAKDEAATFVFECLAQALGLHTWTIHDGTETWDGDVVATLYGILRDSGAIDPETDKPAALSASSVAKPVDGQMDLPVVGEREGVDYLRGQIGEILVLELDADEGSRALSQAVERILALSALSHPAQGWRDIASAPRDGTWILAVRDQYVPETCFWDGEEWMFDEGQDPGTHYHPAHWMPLPSAPAGGRR